MTQRNASGSSGTPAAGTDAPAVSYQRDPSALNQTPSTPLLLDEADLLAVPDVPPPSYEEATAGQPPPGRPPGFAAGSTQQQQQPPPQPPRRPASSSMPGAYPRPASFGGHPGGGSGGGGLAPAPSTAAGRRASATHAPPAASVSPLPSFGGGDGKRPALPARQQQGPGGGGGGGGSSSSSSAAAVRPTQPAAGSVPRCQQFPPVFNLYGDGLSHRFGDGSYGQQYWVGEHQHQPLYAVVLRTSIAWAGPGGRLAPPRPVLVVHNGPNAATAPVLAAVQYVGGGTPLADLAATAADITLPPPLTYSGRGSTAVRLALVYGWSHAYHFAMEVGTSVAGAHMEAFEWRHSTGAAVAALGGARDGWKLVRCSAPVPPAAAAQGRGTSDGHEVVAMMADVRMSLTKHLKFAFAGTGRSGVLGERWAVMAVTSALVVWEKEMGIRGR